MGGHFAVPVRCVIAVFWLWAGITGGGKPAGEMLLLCETESIGGPFNFKSNFYSYY
jgi:hypothetical protein